jgi:tetratricopeptide (TPR) repeat protein
VSSRKVFISYSHKDEAWKDRLVAHLGVLEEQGLLETWDDRKIKAGGDWQAEIEGALERAEVAVLLVSANSLTSKFILKEEVHRLLERKAAEGVQLFPVIVKSCAWQRVPWLTKMQVRPLDGRALASFQGNRRDEALARIADEVLTLLAEEPSPQELPPAEPQRQPAVEPEQQASPEPQRPAQPVSTPALHQLPSPPADFTGREAELAELLAAVGKYAKNLVLVRGTGGVGKTALALKLAQELSPAYPDAQLYLDLKGPAKQPLSAAQAMAHVIRAYQPLAQLPESEAELAGAYRTVLHGQRALLLMDNAASSPKRVEALVPPAGCLLLLTSRFHFNLPGLFTKNLDELPDGDALALLHRIAPRVGEQALQIARLCGNLPIALRLAGGALAEQPWLPPAEYARRLTEAQTRVGLIEGTLTASYELLSEELQALWRRLAVFPGTFDAAAAAVVLGRKLRAAEEALGELARSSLVEWEEEGEDEPGRFRLHDLARVFADARLSAAERDGAQQQHAAHYVEVLRTADRLYEEGGSALLQGLRLFDREWGNVQAGQAWAAARAGEDDGAAELCSAYPDAGAYLVHLRQHPREQAGWLQAALAAARRGNDRAAEGQHLGNLGLAYAALGETRRAIEHYEQHLAIARDTGDRRGEGQALGNLGSAYLDLGETRRAIEHYEQRLAIAREIGDRRGEGNTLGNLGLAYADLDETRRAIEHYEQHLAIACEIGDRRGEGQALGNLGNAYRVLGETRRAIEHQEKALAIDREIGDRHGEGQDLGNLGLAYADLGETGRAIEHYEQQLAIAREFGDRIGEAIASWNLGLALEQEGELTRAADLMQVRVDYERSVGHADAEKNAAPVAALRARIAGGEPSPEGGHG